MNANEPGQELPKLPAGLSGVGLVVRLAVIGAVLACIVGSFLYVGGGYAAQALASGAGECV